MVKNRDAQRKLTFERKNYCPRTLEEKRNDPEQNKYVAAKQPIQIKEAWRI